MIHKGREPTKKGARELRRFSLGETEIGWTWMGVRSEGRTRTNSQACPAAEVEVKRSCGRGAQREKVRIDNYARRIRIILRRTRWMRRPGKSLEGKRCRQKRETGWQDVGVDVNNEEKDSLC